MKKLKALLNPKALIVATMLSLGSLAPLAPSASAADYRDFAIANRNRGASIVQAWFARSGSERWRPIDLSSPIYPLTRSWINVNLPAGQERFDIMVRFNDGYVAVARNVDLSEVSVINAD